ncbi:MULTISPECIES: hypothetical protein [Micrococcaceae]|uniref:hypothetical protein n=1 Tax=Micrococcaceae TaxID=1268 RepID=UPI000B2F292F|nr:MULTISPECIES: hypothetical protein [Micrococcaceae]RKS20867.1 hypothetical protein DFO58_1414 [Arthrobacter sp. AG1021]
MKQGRIAALAACLSLGLVSCTSPGLPQGEEIPTPTPTTSCDRPYVVSAGQSEGKPQFIRVDRFYDQDLGKTVLDQEVASSVAWTPLPAWDNLDAVVTAVNAVSPDRLEELPFPRAGEFDSLLANSDRSAGNLVYLAATPLTHEFSVQCQNEPENRYKLEFSTWIDPDSGVLDCSLTLDAKAPDAARKAYGAYCQEA